jgi:hypothetical protein
MCEECFKDKLDCLEILRRAYNDVYDEHKTTKLRRGVLSKYMVAKLSAEEKDKLIQELFIPDRLEEISKFDAFSQILDGIDPKNPSMDILSKIFGMDKHDRSPEGEYH